MTSEDIKLDKIFVIIDPTSDRQRALEKATDLARHYRSTIHAYLCVYSRLETDDPERLKRVELERYNLWLEQFLEPIRAEGIAIELQVDYSPSWREAMRDAAISSGSDLIIKPTNRTRRRGLLMTSSDMMLFEAAKSRVLLTSPTEQEGSYKILAAVDPGRDDARYQQMFDSLMKTAKHIEAVHADKGAELHVVHSYEDPDDYMHVTDIAKATGVDSKRVHVAGGKPGDVIQKVAAELNAYLVIIGLSTGSRVSQRLFGATSDWILNNVDHDILVIMR